MKKYILFAFALALVGLVRAETIQEIQTIDGETANRLQTILESNSGGGSASTNGANQAWSGTNTFNGPTSLTNTTINGVLTINNSTNYIYKGALVLGTNSTTALLLNYDFMIDQRAGVAKGYAQAGLYGKTSQGAYLFVGGPTEANSVVIQCEGGNIGQVFNNSSVGVLNVGTSKAGGSTVIFNGAVAAERFKATASGGAIGPNGVALTNVVSATIVADPPSLNTLTGFTTNFVCTGAIAGSPVIVSSDYITNGIMYSGYCLTNGSIWVDFRNVSAGTIDTASQTLRAIQFGVQP
jgi:hypothetical protein